MRKGGPLRKDIAVIIVVGDGASGRLTVLQDRGGHILCSPPRGEDLGHLSTDSVLLWVKPDSSGFGCQPCGPTEQAPMAGLKVRCREAGRGGHPGGPAAASCVGTGAEHSWSGPYFPLLCGSLLTSLLACPSLSTQNSPSSDPCIFWC